MSELQKLLERVEKATGPDRAIDLRLHGRFWDWMLWTDADIKYALKDIEGTTNPPKFTASIDAALALVERVLPGTVRPGFQQNPDKSWNAAILRVEPDDDECPCATAPTASLAIIAALLKALISQEQQK